MSSYTSHFRRPIRARASATGITREGTAGRLLGLSHRTLGKLAIACIGAGLLLSGQAAIAQMPVIASAPIGTGQSSGRGAPIFLWPSGLAPVVAHSAPLIFSHHGVPFLPPAGYRAPLASGASSSWPTFTDFSSISLPSAPSSLPSSTAPTPSERLSAAIQVSVFAAQETLTTEGVQRSFDVRDVETAPGTFGDLPRFIQTLAGVVSDNDQRNDYLVRGGSPTENLFMIDNIEVPSINQLALSDSTGGLVSMLDNNAIQRFSFQDDAYSSRYDQRLSSVVDISTRTYGPIEPHRQTEIGIAGAGGYQADSFGRNGAYFLSARSGILQYITDNVGFNGTPHYRNLFARAENTLGAHDSWWGMSLFGIDSIEIRPSATDFQETNPFNINYSGWRNATGVNWQHIFSPKAFAVASVAHTEQTQSMAEFDQLQGSELVYNEHSRDSISTLKYDVTVTPASWFFLQFGGRGALDGMGYNVNQPLGLQNAYSTDPTPANPGSFSSNHPALSSAAYADATWILPLQIHISAGERYSQWSVDGRSALTGRGSIVAPIFGHSVFVNYAEHAQLPPELYLLAFNNLATLRPIRSRQFSTGVTAIDRNRVHLTLAAYSKRYSDYPVSTQFPQLSLANISDTFGQAFLLFPMNAQGTGIARGVEATFNAALTSRLSINGTASYARSWFAGQDGILRRGNFDIPLATNVMARWNVGKEFLFSARFNATSGRPYTADNLPLSIAQNRDVYDLNRVNALRSWSYQRLDVHFEQSHMLNKKKLTWWVGMENVLNRKNFYDQLWEPRVASTFPGSNETAPGAQSQFQSVQHQMGIFPDGGIKLSF